VFPGQIFRRRSSVARSDILDFGDGHRSSAETVRRVFPNSPRCAIGPADVIREKQVEQSLKDAGAILRS
jgi:hypothetical protein